MIAAEPRTVADTLKEAREATLATLRARLPSGASPDQFYEIVADYPQRPGKGIRAALCLASCRAHGGSTDDALAVATAIELLHNAFLVHDDICDAASMRRGAPSLHKRHGIPLGLVAGNALASLALELLLEDHGRRQAALTLEVMFEIHHMTRRTLEGQAHELIARTQVPEAELAPEDYLSLVLDKTCWYSAIYPCRVGALIGSRGEADLDAIAGYGFFVGAVLQIRNDLDSLTDRSQRAGQEFGADIIEGKPTLPLIHLRRNASERERQRLARLVGPNGRRSGAPATERIASVIKLMHAHGSIDYARAFADGLAGAALAEFERSMGWLPESPDKHFLRSLVLELRNPAEPAPTNP